MYKKYFTVSFDDGIRQDKRLIKLMKKYNIKGTFNLSSGLFGKKTFVARVGEIGFMNLPNKSKIRKALFPNTEHFINEADEAGELYNGFEVASHGYKHEAVPFASTEKITSSLMKDQKNLSTMFGYDIQGYAYPGGISSKKAAECLKKLGFVYGREAFTSDSFAFPENPLRYRPTCSQKSKNVFDLIHQFIDVKAEKEDLLFMIWGHSYELDYNSKNSSWERLESIFHLISNRDDIEYCTNLEAFKQHKNNKKLKENI